MFLPKKIKITKKIYNDLSQDPGVYIFWDKKQKPLYIGKSSNIKKRVQSYFSLTLSPKTSQMMSEANFISTIRVMSELEALLLEAKLVRKFQTKFNSQLKDDKHPLYIRITRELYPQVLTARKIDSREGNISFFGPFPSSAKVKNVLRLLRRIFPFAQHKVGNRGCLFSQIGLCVPCPSVIDKENDPKLKNLLRKKYRKNIFYIRQILSGKLLSVRTSLERQMILHSQKENFEAASKVRDQVQMLNYITQPIISVNEFLLNPNLVDDVRDEERLSLQRILSDFNVQNTSNNIRRIECFDVAHITGVRPTASMVTLVDGEPDKSLYRHFRIHLPAGKAGQKMGQDDISSLQEIARRRKLHFADWGIPDLILVDGGKAQVGTFWNELKDHKIPILGLAKRFETLVIPHFEEGKLKFYEKRLNGPALNLLQRIRNEAHRFARRYHHKLLQKDLLEN